MMMMVVGVYFNTHDVYTHDDDEDDDDDDEYEQTNEDGAIIYIQTHIYRVSE